MSITETAKQFMDLIKHGSSTTRETTNRSVPMEELTTTNYLENLPKRKRRFHQNAFKRIETNYNGTMKMLKLLEPAGVQCNARAFDIINAKFGL